MKVVLLAVFMLETLKLSRDDFNVKYKNGNLPFFTVFILDHKNGHSQPLFNVGGGVLRDSCLLW